MRERERERERFSPSVQPAWLMRTGLCSCLSLLQQGNETMADRLLVLVPNEHTRNKSSIFHCTCCATRLGMDGCDNTRNCCTQDIAGHIASSGYAGVFAEKQTNQKLERKSVKYLQACQMLQLSPVSEMSKLLYFTNQPQFILQKESRSWENCFLKWSSASLHVKQQAREFGKLCLKANLQHLLYCISSASW